MTQDEARALVEECGSQRAAAKKAGIARSTLQRILKGATVKPRTTKPEPRPAASKQGRSLIEFRQQYDKDYIIPHKVKAQVQDMGASWLYESEFAKAAGVSLADLGNYRDQFADLVVTMRDSRRVWAGTAKLAQQLREMI